MNLPDGHVLEEVSPGLFRLRPVDGRATVTDEHMGSTAGAAPDEAPLGQEHVPVAAKKKAPSVLFRERQKKLMSDLEAQVLEKLEELKLLSKENELLRLKGRVLQRAVESWDDQIDIMQSMGAVRQPTRINNGAHSSPSSSGGPSLSGGSARASGTVSTSAATASIATAAAAPPLTPPLGCDDPCWWKMRTAPDPTTYVRQLTTQDVRALLSEYVHHVSRELLALDKEEGQHNGTAAAAATAAAGPSIGDLGAAEDHPHPFLFYGSPQLPEDCVPGSARARVYTLVNRYMGALKHTHLLNTCVVEPLVGLNLQTGTTQNPPCGLWRNVVDSLGLSQSQVEDICALHDLYTKHISSVMSQRAEVQALIGTGPSFTEDMEVAQALAANMKRELSLRLLLHTFVLDRVLTFVQLARVAMSSWPMFPDVYALVCLTAKMTAEAEAAAGAAPRVPVFSTNP